MNPQSEYEIDDALAHTMDERDCLLPDDDTAVERLDIAIARACDALGVTSLCPGDGPVLLARLREGGQP